MRHPWLRNKLTILRVVSKVPKGHNFHNRRSRLAVMEILPFRQSGYFSRSRHIHTSYIIPHSAFDLPSTCLRPSICLFFYKLFSCSTIFPGRSDAVTAILSPSRLSLFCVAAYIHKSPASCMAYPSSTVGCDVYLM
jgi:hypothetical protein